MIVYFMQVNWCFIDIINQQETLSWTTHKYKSKLPRSTFCLHNKLLSNMTKCHCRMNPCNIHNYIMKQKKQILITLPLQVKTRTDKYDIKSHTKTKPIVGLLFPLWHIHFTFYWLPWWLLYSSPLGKVYSEVEFHAVCDRSCLLPSYWQFGKYKTTVASLHQRSGWKRILHTWFQKRKSNLTSSKRKTNTKLLSTFLVSSARKPILSTMSFTLLKNNSWLLSLCRTIDRSQKNNYRFKSHFEEHVLVFLTNRTFYVSNWSHFLRTIFDGHVYFYQSRWFLNLELVHTYILYKLSLYSQNFNCRSWNPFVTNYRPRSHQQESARVMFIEMRHLTYFCSFYFLIPKTENYYSGL